MEAWLIWLVVAGVLVALEVATLTLVLGMAAVGAALAMVVALFGAPAWLQMVTFIGVTGAMLLVIKPIARRHTRVPIALRTGTAALVGQTGRVINAVDANEGRITLAGEEWSARTFDRGEVIPAGERVHIVQIDGATALVIRED